MTRNNKIFQLNVGFIIHQANGFYREFVFDLPTVDISPDLHLTDLWGKVDITRTTEGLLLQANITTQIHSVCSRCMDSFQQTIHSDFSELYIFSSRPVSDSNMVVPETGIIDISDLLREYIILEDPINPLCKPDCKGLCYICGDNQNITSCNHSENTIDSRMERLKLIQE